MYVDEDVELTSAVMLNYFGQSQNEIPTSFSKASTPLNSVRTMQHRKQNNSNVKPTALHHHTTTSSLIMCGEMIS